MNAFYEKYQQDIDEHLAKYPPDRKRSAVMPLLYIAMREDGYISKEEIRQIAEILGMSPTEVVSISGFYTLFHTEPGGKLRIQVCTDVCCALRGADKFLEDLCESLGVKPGETSEDGFLIVEPVMCLASCDKAPMFQCQTTEGIAHHEEQTVESALEVIEDYRKKENAQ